MLDAVLDNVPTTMYAPEEIAAGTVVTLVDAVLDNVPTTLYAPEEIAAGTVVTLVDALGAVGNEVCIVL